MIHRARLLVTALVCCTGLLLGACGGGGGDTGTSASGATGEPVAGGEARILLLSEPRTMDPAVIGNVYASGALIGNALYGTLMTDDEAGEIHYSMAESFESADNGKTFELKLRPGLVFSDGTPLNADAVKFNWDRTKEPATGSASRADAAMIASSEVVDDVTLRVTLVTPVPKYSEAIVTSTLNWIASPAALRKGGPAFDKNPIGAGPFTLQNWARQDNMRLVKNPRYWDAPRPYLDSLVLRPAQDSNQRYNTLLTGGADLAVDSSWINLGKADEAGLPVDFLPASGGIVAALNTRRAPFDDVRARQAVAKALDMDALNLAVWNGSARMATTLFTDSSPFYSPTPLQKTDKATAQKLFDELAAEGKPVSFSFTTTPASENRKMAENIQAQLSAFKNVKFQVRVIEVAEFSALRTSHDYDAVLTSSMFLDPDPRLPTTLLGGSPANLSMLDDPQLNESLLAGRTATTVEERKKAYDRVQARLTEVVPMIFFARGPLGAISARNVGGVTQYGLGSLLPEKLWIQS
ncbi:MULTISPECIES: ABC transporter substrate-binding protein [unclassified Parafrankia]|uniref:ABC transporter substrate-binding protein n=1 Tax=unclassified Parafrankia TaxID=2994368 RepID=UPI000DD47CF3|nr:MULTISPECIES: ABC transporter substrate-binding protein [unclassified Parafrankia]TCJ34090.1 ABC transporter substrate-binding protein [Parafrankia sp. BMG5.11]